MNSPTSTSNDKKGKVLFINDAIHGVMCFPSPECDYIREIIKDPLFQRLRYIKQMGMVDLIFPTANHTRFSHCIGSGILGYENGTKIKRF